MAAHSPRDTDNPSDDSHIFRRSVPKPAEPEEPIELLDFEEILDGDEDAIGGPTAANPNDSPSVIVRRGYSEGKVKSK